MMPAMSSGMCSGSSTSSSSSSSSGGTTACTPGMTGPGEPCFSDGDCTTCRCNPQTMACD
jgi:hypothetical protein